MRLMGGAPSFKILEHSVQLVQRLLRLLVDQEGYFPSLYWDAELFFLLLAEHNPVDVLHMCTHWPGSASGQS